MYVHVPATTAADHSPTLPLMYEIFVKMNLFSQKLYQVRLIVMQRLYGNKIKSSSQIMHRNMAVNSSRSDYGS
jgi:hypothetical protein